jgi:hypothetical protein
MQTSSEDQFKRVMLERLSEENQKVKKLKSEIKSKFQEICDSKLSKETKREIVIELKKYLEYGEPWINNSSEIKDPT